MQFTLKVGTRGSRLALIQTHYVVEKLKALEPRLDIEVVIIRTEGDKNMAPVPLDTVGKAWFTAEIDHALSRGKIDFAVHSLKDLALSSEPELELAIVLERDDPRDVLVSKVGSLLEQLPEGAVIGTDSTRRGAELRHYRPDLAIRSLRGNVITRLDKLNHDNYDAIVLAAAGLNRLGLTGRITQFLDPQFFVPSVGQGTIAVKFRRDHDELRQLLRRSADGATVAASLAERSFSETIGGGCKTPVGCYATIADKQITLCAMVADPTGEQVYFQTATGPETSGVQLARSLAHDMVARCGFELNLS